jgi:hypothetical protein
LATLWRLISIPPLLGKSLCGGSHLGSKPAVLSL